MAGREGRGTRTPRRRSGNKAAAVGQPPLVGPLMRVKWEFGFCFSFSGRMSLSWGQFFFFFWSGFCFFTCVFFKMKLKGVECDADCNYTGLGNCCFF